MLVFGFFFFWYKLIKARGTYEDIDQRKGGGQRDAFPQDQGLILSIRFQGSGALFWSTDGHADKTLLNINTMKIRDEGESKTI